MSAASTLAAVERVVHHFGGQVGEIMAFAGEVAREIALIAAEDPDVGCAHARDATTTKRVTRAHSARGEGGPAGSMSEPTRPQRTRWSTIAFACTGALPAASNDKRLHYRRATTGNLWA